MTPEVATFTATEFTMIDIIPSVKMDRLPMIKAEYGPFRPQIRCTVPLWLALAMRSSGQCRLLLPEWLSPSNLGKVLAAERERPEEFASGLDPRYMEIFMVLQQAAPEDFMPELPEIQRLIQSIKEVRQQKIIFGLASLDGSALFVRLFPLKILICLCSCGMWECWR
jgi:GINS complex subunit 2